MIQKFTACAQIHEIHACRVNDLCGWQYENSLWINQTFTQTMNTA